MSDECELSPVSSRTCERGTKSCEVRHTSELPSSTGSAALPTAPLPCPFCGVEANITRAPHGPRIYCRHDDTCLLRASLVYDFQLLEWNRRWQQND